MLAVLNDKSTRAELVTNTKASSATAPAATTKPVRTENGVLVIDAAQIAQTVAEDIYRTQRPCHRHQQVVTKREGRHYRRARAPEKWAKSRRIISIISCVKRLPRCSIQMSCSARHVTACTTVTPRKLAVVAMVTTQPSSTLRQRPLPDEQNQNTADRFHHQPTLAFIRRHFEWPAVSRSRFDRSGRWKRRRSRHSP